MQIEMQIIYGPSKQQEYNYVNITLSIEYNTEQDDRPLILRLCINLPLITQLMKIS